MTITTLYFLGFAGILQVHTDLIPDVPDTITFSVIVGALATANIIQYRENRKQRDLHRGDLKDQANTYVKLIENNTRAMEKLVDRLDHL